MKTYTGNFSTDTGTSLVNGLESHNFRALRHRLIYLAKGEIINRCATIHIWEAGIPVHSIAYGARVTKGGRVTIYI